MTNFKRFLTEKVFHYAKDSKKAAGRALGTLVEIITFYALKSWELERHVAIERKLPEFANDDITHNVEYSLHPATPLAQIEFNRDSLPLTTTKIARHEKLAALGITDESLRKSTLLSNELILRNSCTVSESDDHFLNAYLDTLGKDTGVYSIVSLRQRPFAIILLRVTFYNDVATLGTRGASPIKPRTTRNTRTIPKLNFPFAYSAYFAVGIHFRPESHLPSRRNA